MKVNKKMNTVSSISAALVLFLITVSSTTSAASSPKITETQIITGANPAIYGDRIVCTDSRSGNLNHLLENSV